MSTPTAGRRSGSQMNIHMPVDDPDATVEVPPVRQPHLIGGSPRRATSYGRLMDVYTFAPFELDEPRPEWPAEWPGDTAWTPGQQDSVRREFEAAETAWKISQHMLGLAKMIVEVQPYARAFVVAYQAVQAAYAHVIDAPDGQWRSSIARLLAAQDTVQTAASDWFSRYDQLFDLELKWGERIAESAGGWRDIAGQAGVDVSMWTRVSDLRALAQELEDQRSMVRRTLELAGDRSPVI